MRPGDILVTNDPWKGTGHLPDVCIVQPIFRGDHLVAFAATTSHVPNIGGRIRALEAREIYEEGLQIPLMKLSDAGQVNDFLVRMIRMNVRTPDQTMGDIWAQAGAGGSVHEALVDSVERLELLVVVVEPARATQVAVLQAQRGQLHGWPRHRVDRQRWLQRDLEFAAIG